MHLCCKWFNQNHTVWQLTTDRRICLWYGSPRHAELSFRSAHISCIGDICSIATDNNWVRCCFTAKYSFFKDERSYEKTLILIQRMFSYLLLYLLKNHQHISSKYQNILENLCFFSNETVYRKQDLYTKKLWTRFFNFCVLRCNSFLWKYGVINISMSPTLSCPTFIIHLQSSRGVRSLLLITPWEPRWLNNEPHSFICVSRKDF